jgi:hypothetical protein
VGVEQFRGYLAAIVAAICVIGGAAALVYIWSLPATEPPREIALIFGVLGGLIGTGTTFLFVQEGASRAAHASERANAAGAVIGAQTPGQTSTDVPPPGPNVGEGFGGPGPADAT